MNTTEDALQDAEMPKDAKIIALILKSLGVKEYEPRVLHQFLEFMHSNYLFSQHKYPPLFTDS